MAEDNWILKMQDEMDVKQIFTILQISFIINEIEIELFQLKDSNCNDKRIENTLKKLNRWKERRSRI